MDNDIINGYKETDRLSELGSLKKGWHDGEGEEISEIAIRNARKLRDSLKSSGIPCCVSPTFEGGVNIEDVDQEGDGDKELDAELDTEGMFLVVMNPDGSAVVYGFDEGSPDEDHQDGSLLPGCSPWLTRFIQKNQPSV